MRVPPPPPIRPWLPPPLFPSGLSPTAAVALSAAANQWLIAHAVALCDRLIARALGGGGGGADKTSPLAHAVHLLELATALRASKTRRDYPLSRG